MKETDGTGQETHQFSLPIEALISAFRDAADASLTAVEQLDDCAARESDDLTAAKLEEEIQRAEHMLLETLEAICSYQTTSLVEVHKKLGLWHENACNDDCASAPLSPMDQLVQSAYEDISRLLAA